jgi:hypothetical protein
MVSCPSCGKAIEELDKVIAEIIEGKHYSFDNKDCVLLFKKLEKKGIDSLA